MKNILFMITLATLVGFSETAVAQCSDAGACAIGIKPQSAKHKVGAEYIYSKSGGTDNLKFNIFRIDAEFQILEQSRVTLSLPYSFNSGPLGSTEGLGDLTALWSQQVLSDDRSALSLQFGGKLGIGQDDGGNLPQAYQSSLGTNDLLLGVTYENGSWNGAVAYQISRGRSGNRVTRLKRGDDLLLRGGYRVSYERATILLDLLAIKRVEESSVLVPATGRFVDVPESDQFQLNVQGRVFYPLGDDYTLQIRGAIPFLQRDVNVDGLKRGLTLSIGIAYAFE